MFQFNTFLEHLNAMYENCENYVNNVTHQYYSAIIFSLDICLSLNTGWERTVHVSCSTAVYSGRIFASICREVFIFGIRLLCVGVSA